MATALKKNRKIFVLDTNVLLHDYKCMHNFDEHDVIIPITVLEELDRFKKGNDMINYHAREFTRELDKLSGDKLFNGGLSLGKGKGKLSIETGRPASERLKTSFPENTPDHRILAIAEHLHLKNGEERPVILITKDINLRMKAKSLGIMAQDYHNDMVQNIEDIYESVKSSDV
ncbi:MAG: PIN domain-containing protein, partial [Bacteroidales bacterium]